MLNLIAGKSGVAIANDPTHLIGYVDNVHTYDREYQQSDAREEYAATSRHTVNVTDHNKFIATCMLLTGGASGIHERSASIHDNSCIITVGPFLASLALPTLDLNWATQADDATCFGVHKSLNHNCLNSHGEMVLARVKLLTVQFNGGLASLRSSPTTVNLMVTYFVSQLQ